MKGDDIKQMSNTKVLLIAGAATLFLKKELRCIDLFVERVCISIKRCLSGCVCRFECVSGYAFEASLAQVPKKKRLEQIKDTFR